MAPHTNLTRPAVKTHQASKHHYTTPPHQKFLRSEWLNISYGGNSKCLGACLSSALTYEVQYFQRFTIGLKRITLVNPWFYMMGRNGPGWGFQSPDLTFLPFSIFEGGIFSFESSDAGDNLYSNQTCVPTGCEMSNRYCCHKKHTLYLLQNSVKSHSLFSNGRPLKMLRS